MGKISQLFLSVALLVLAGGTAQAVVVAGPTIGGVATFTDLNTGRNWARMDTYFNVSHNFMASDIAGKGFTVAMFGDVNALLSTLPLTGGEWSGYSTIMGSAPNRDLIWGSFDPVSSSGNIDWAFATNGDTAWTSFNGSFPANQVPNGGGQFADMNIWAFAGANVPEPASWALMIAGFGMVGGAMRRRAAVTA